VDSPADTVEVEALAEEAMVAGADTANLRAVVLLSCPFRPAWV
jgi:hypothetical protein